MSERQIKDFFLDFIGQYYINVLKQLSDSIKVNFNQYDKKLIKSVCSSLKASIDRLRIDEWGEQQLLQQVPFSALDIFQLLQNINEDPVLEQAKFDVLRIISFFVDGVGRYYKQQSQILSSGLQYFIENWAQVQVEVANIFLQAIQHANSFDLYSDYQSINDLFELMIKLLDKNGTQQFIHVQAAQLLQENAQQIIQNIIQTIINAGYTRYQHFQQDDLLVIDSLRSAIDLVNRLADLNQQISNDLFQAAQQMLQDFINQQIVLDKNNQDQQCQLFAGLMLIRRAIPNVEYKYKVRAAVVSLQASCQIHEIVFEEAAKLIINLIYEDQPYNQSQEINQIGITYQELLQQCENNQDCTKQLIDVLIQEYMMQDRTTFVYRMLSGILSRPIRRKDIPTQLQMQLLTQSINLLLTNYRQNQKAGMITLIRTIVQEQNSNNREVQQTIARVITQDPHYVQIPELIKANDINAKIYAESAISVIDMLIDQVNEIDEVLLEALIKLSTNILSANMTISQALFKVLNKLQFDNAYSIVNGILIQQILQGFTSLLQQPTITLSNAIIDSLTFIDKLSQCYGYKSLVINVHQDPIIQFGISLISQYKSYIQFTNQQYFNLQHANLMLFSGVFIISNILSKINKQNVNEQIALQLLQIICDPITELYQEQQVAFVQTQDSETKRMFLLFYSQLFLQYCKLVQICQDISIDVNQYLKPILNITNINAVIVSFSALWAIQDKDNQVGHKWRYQLSYSAVGATNILLQLHQKFSQQGQFPNTFIILLIMAQHNLLQQRSLQFNDPPIVSFNILQTNDSNMTNIFQLVFSDMSSKAILQVISEGKQAMPFWAGVERTNYSESIRNIGNNEGYQLCNFNDDLNILRQQLTNGNYIQYIPQEFVVYLQQQYQYYDGQLREMALY